MADIYGEKGDWQKYLECSEFSVNWIEENRDNRNLWGARPPNTAYYLMRVGIGLNKVGQRAAGIAKFEQGMKQYHDGLQLEETHGETLYYAFDIIEPATEFYLETNQNNKAVAIWEEYIHLSEPFVEKNPDDTTSLGLLSHALERKGDVLAKYRKEQEIFAQTEMNSLRAALKSYGEAATRQQRMVQLDPTNQSHLAAEKTLTRKILLLNERLKRAG